MAIVQPPPVCISIQHRLGFSLYYLLVLEWLRMLYVMVSSYGHWVASYFCWWWLSKTFFYLIFRWLSVIKIYIVTCHYWQPVNSACCSYSVTFHYLYLHWLHEYLSLARAIQLPPMNASSTSLRCIQKTLCMRWPCPVGAGLEATVHYLSSRELQENRE